MEFFSVRVHVILPAVLGPGIYSASNRNEYQKQKNNVSGSDFSSIVSFFLSCHNLDCSFLDPPLGSPKVSAG
jgi:hypothetical protein